MADELRASRALTWAEQQQEAWQAVWQLLCETYPGILDLPQGSGMEKALAAIRDLTERAARSETTPMLDGLLKDGEWLYSRGRDYVLGESGRRTVRELCNALKAQGSMGAPCKEAIEAAHRIKEQWIGDNVETARYVLVANEILRISGERPRDA